MTAFDLVVVGAGVIGLSTAWHAAAGGARVAVLDPHPGRGASYAAAGMLAPVTEAAYGEQALTALALRSAAAWPAFALALQEASGLGLGLERDGTLLVASDPSDRAALVPLFELHRELGLDSRWCNASECRELEPLLAPRISGGLFAAGDQQVDNRRLLGALAVATQRAGVIFLEDEAEELLTEGARVVGVRARSGRRLRAAATLLASGVSSAVLAPAELPPPHPVKGQILRLRTPAPEVALSRTVRAMVRGRSVYIVPRADGRVVVGATVEEHEAPRRVTVGGVQELLGDAVEILPTLREYELLEAYTAARPGSPDNAPIVGESARPGLFVATGHYRHGILLTPVTVEIIGIVLAGGPLPEWASALSPARFARVRPAEMAPFSIVLNGERTELASGTTVAEVVASLVPTLAGCAVALNGEVLPRSSWSAEPLAAEDRVEVLGAVAGG